MSENNNQLIEFLREVTRRLDENLLTTNQIDNLLEFQKKYNETNDIVIYKPKFTDEDIKDMFKILIIGCYIYRLANIIKVN